MSAEPTCYCGHVRDEHNPSCVVEGCSCVHYDENPDADESMTQAYDALQGAMDEMTRREESDELLETRDCLEDVLDEILQRDDAILRCQPRCPACGDAQVQILSKAQPAQWRCRVCRREFELEPENER